MLLEMLFVLVIAAAIAAVATPKPQPLRVRREPTRQELLAAVIREREERRTR